MKRAINIGCYATSELCIENSFHQNSVEIDHWIFSVDQMKAVGGV